jgi:hypothetical protein
MIHFKSLTFAFLFTLISIGYSNAQSNILYPKNEFRAVWIATVANIDWPKNNTNSVDKEKADFIEILDSYKK